MKIAFVLAFLAAAGVILFIFRESKSSDNPCTVTVNSVEALKQALKQAQNNNRDDVICIHAGIYEVTETLTYSTPHDDGGSKLTIKAVGGQVMLNGGNSTRIMMIKTESDVTIEGITFQNGKSVERGGGLYIKTTKANITLIKNTFSGNEADGDGGGTFVDSKYGIVILTNNIFNSNTAGKNGGGAAVISEYGTVIFSNNVFNGNKALHGGGGAIVGLIYNNATLTDNIFNGNTAIYGGGAVAISKYGTVNLTNNTFNGNTAFHSSGASAVSVHSDVTLSCNTFSGNIAVYYGAGVYAASEFGNVALYGNIFKGNISNGTRETDGGGGAYVMSKYRSVILVNNIFDSNTARQYGGGFVARLEEKLLKVYNNTLYNNIAANGGGAYIFLVKSSAEAYIANNVFWQNHASAGSNDGDDLFINSDYDRLGDSSVINLYNNNFSGNANFNSGKSEDLFITVVQQGKYNHANNIQVNPYFVNAHAGDFRLQAGSPLINKGYNNLPGGLPQKDRDGNSRVLGGAVDIGAYEYQSRGSGGGTDR